MIQLGPKWFQLAGQGDHDSWHPTEQRGHKEVAERGEREYLLDSVPFCNGTGRYGVHVPLVDSRKVFLPPLHIKLGLMKNFVQSMDKILMVFSISEVSLVLRKT